MDSPETAAGAGCAIYAVVLLVVNGLFGLVGYSIGKGKGQAGLGFILGFVLGILGLIIISFMGGSGTPYRRRRIVRRARVSRRPSSR